VARFAYNWGLAEWRRRYAAGETPNEVALRKALNAIKHEQCPWMREVTKNAPQQAIKNLGRAYANWFAVLKRGDTRVKPPTYKEKGQVAGELSRR
jgi:putative transposase